MPQRKLDKGRPDGGFHTTLGAVLFLISGLLLAAAFGGYDGPNIEQLAAAAGCFTLALSFWAIGQILYAISFLPGRSESPLLLDQKAK